QGMGSVRHSKVDHVFAPVLGNSGERQVDQIAVWIKQGETSPGVHIPADERMQQGRFAGAGLADDVHVRSSVGLPDTEEPPVAAEVGACEETDAVVGVGCHASIIFRKQAMLKAGRMAGFGQSWTLPDSLRSSGLEVQPPDKPSAQLRSISA